MIRAVSEARLPDEGDKTRPSFMLPSTARHYEQQFANMYFTRLAVLRQRLVPRAQAKWAKLADGRRAKHVNKLLDVEKGKLCFIVGTVYVDMPLKPNVLEDLARESYVTAPQPRRKFCSASDEVMLEDASGRVRLVGDIVQAKAGQFVTGTIMAALGAELPTGDFEVIDTCFAGLPPQPARTASTSSKKGEDRWVAIVSGLEMGAEYVAADVRADMLAEWILGELESDSDDALRVSRLILAGNSLGEPEDDPLEDPNKPKRYGYEASSYSAKPTAALDRFLAGLLPSIDIDLMPGETDPTGPTMPQQPLHHAMFSTASAYDGLEGRTNPCWLDIDGASFLGTSGQTLDDIFKYLSTEDRLEMAGQTLEWSHIAPTCPDTLWSYPFKEYDPFLLGACPHVCFIGNQPAFETMLVEDAEEEEGKRCRIVLVPEFCETGTVVLVNTHSLEVKTVQFDVA